MKNPDQYVHVACFYCINRERDVLMRVKKKDDQDSIASTESIFEHIKRFAAIVVPPSGRSRMVQRMLKYSRVLEAVLCLSLIWPGHLFLIKYRLRPFF